MGHTIHGWLGWVMVSGGRLLPLAALFADRSYSFALSFLISLCLQGLRSNMQQAQEAVSVLHGRPGP
jgi:hypothetical protein